MCDVESIFEKCVTIFADTAIHDDVSRQMVYAAVNCGGGEVALYTLFAGILRKELEQADPTLRLAINQEISKYIKPDFKVLKSGDSKHPLFAAEFKLLYETGVSNSSPKNVLQRIQDDLDRLLDISSQAIRTSMIIFHYSERSSMRVEILGELITKGFKHCCTIELWNPSGIINSGYLHLHLSSHKSILDNGKPIVIQQKEG